MADRRISLQLDAPTLARIDELATRLGRVRDRIIGDILQGNLDAYEEQVALIEQRLREVKNGSATLIPHAELDQWLERRRQKGERTSSGEEDAWQDDEAY